MTTAINTNVARLPRVNTEPVSTTPAKPGLGRTNTAPAALPSGKVNTPASAPAAEPKVGFGTKVADAFSKVGSKTMQGLSTAGSKTMSGLSTVGSKVAGGASAAGSAVKGWHSESVDYRTKLAQGSGVGSVGRGMASAGLAGSVFGIGSNAKGLAESIANGDGQGIAANALGLTRGVLGTVKGGLDTAAAFSSAKGFSQLSSEAAKLVGNSHGALSKPIAEAVATAAHKGQALRDVDVLGSIAKAQGGLKGLTHTALGSVAEQLRLGNHDKLASKIENYSAGKGKEIAEKTGAAAKDAAKGADAAADAAKGAKVADAAVDAAKVAKDGLKIGAEGAGTAARIAGRFAPGLNIAMAGVDTAIAARTLADPKASVASKVTSSITAAGSIAAATNIPIVSQVGAGISAASSITGAVINNAGKIKEGFHKLGDKLKSLF